MSLIQHENVPYVSYSLKIYRTFDEMHLNIYFRLHESSQVLQREANLTIMTSSARSLMHQTSSSGIATPTTAARSSAQAAAAANGGAGIPSRVSPVRIGLIGQHQQGR